MIIKCAWCGKGLGEKPPYEDKSVTHGICDECITKYFPQIAKRVIDTGKMAPITPEVTIPKPIRPITEAEKPAVAEYYRKEAAKWRKIADEETRKEPSKEGEQRYAFANQKAEGFERQARELGIALPKTGGNPGFTVEEAKSIGKELSIDFKRYDVEQFRRGMNVELEHCNVTNCDPLLTGKIAQAHLNELPDYYTKLAKMEKEAEKGGLEQKANALLPMTPEEGPPLPRGLGVRWPWKK